MGGALIKDKLFGFISYQHIHDSDQEIGLSPLDRSAGFHRDDRSATSSGARSSDADIANTSLVTSRPQRQFSPIAVALFQYKFPNGQYMIPRGMA